jgi:hypothetical protein
MDFIYTAGTYKDLANYMGLSDKTFQDQAAIAITTTSAGRAIIAAAIGNSGISNTDIDASTILSQAYRTKEDNILTSINPIFYSLLDASDVYFQSVKSSSMRNYFDSKTAATTLDWISSGTAYTTGLRQFRKMYARARSEELLYPLYKVTSNGSGSTTYNSPTVIGYSSEFTSSLLELRLDVGAGSSISGTGTTVNVTAMRSNSTTTDLITVNVATGSTNGNYFAVETFGGSLQKYSSVTQIQLLGNSSTGNTFYIWTR